MKYFMKVVAVAGALFVPTAFAADVGVSVSIGQPGFYGHIDIGDYPPPSVIYRQPRYIESVRYERAPIYLRVPSMHMNNWGHYCGRYHACGERVLFVTDAWYEREYMPYYRDKHRVHHIERYDNHRGPYQGERGYDKHDKGHGKDHGNSRYEH